MIKRKGKSSNPIILCGKNHFEISMLDFDQKKKKEILN